MSTSDELIRQKIKGISTSSRNLSPLDGVRGEADDHQDPHGNETEAHRIYLTSPKMSGVRALALACACSLSIGAHYATYILGPLKTRLEKELGASNTEFSLLLAAFSLNSTWTPLLGGFITTRLGTTFTSIIATGVIFLGQALLLLGDIYGNLRLMAFGMFVFGLGISPLAVVQESIIVRFFRGHNLGTSMAIGLVVGKAASYVSARTSFALADTFGRHAPFYVATSLALFSFVVNLVYLWVSRWLIEETGTELEASEMEREARRVSVYDAMEAEALERIALKRRVHLTDLLEMDSVFWVYVGLNVLCGAIWAPFTHLAANILQIRYHLSESEAARQASFLLAGSIFLYPLCGFLIDRSKSGAIILRLFIISSILQLFCYVWLALPPSLTKTSIYGIISFGGGVGFSTLLLVVIVPQLVAPKFISTTLGVHKSLEQSGTTITQTLAGLLLDRRKGKKSEPSPQQTQLLINSWVILNVIQLGCILGLYHLDRRRRTSAGKKTQEVEFHDVPEDEWPISRRRSMDAQGLLAEEHRPLLPNSMRSSSALLSVAPSEGSPSVVPDTDIPSDAERRTRRSTLFAAVCGGIIVSAWLLFLGTAWLKLRAKNDR